MSGSGSAFIPDLYDNGVLAEAGDASTPLNPLASPFPKTPKSLTEYILAAAAAQPSIESVRNEDERVNFNRLILQHPNPPFAFLCPLTLTIMFDPVVAADGHTYERETIQRWLTTNNKSYHLNPDIRSQLLELMDGDEADKVVQNVERRGLLMFLAQAMPFMLQSLKPIYTRGMLADIFIEELNRLIVSEAQRNDFVNPADKNPMTNIKLDNKKLSINWVIRGAIKEFLDGSLVKDMVGDSIEMLMKRINDGKDDDKKINRKDALFLLYENDFNVDETYDTYMMTQRGKEKARNPVRRWKRGGTRRNLRKKPRNQRKRYTKKRK